MKLKEAILGRKVIYTPRGDYENRRLEEGVITSSNSKFVFVRYGADYGSKATDPDDLKYL